MLRKKIGFHVRERYYYNQGEICNDYWVKILKRSDSRKNTNIPSGFRAVGLWPLFFPAMRRLLNLFKDGGIADSEENPAWMRCQENFRT